jgi:protein involved in polysaccharide export with SLBB domain
MRQSRLGARFLGLVSGVAAMALGLAGCQPNEPMSANPPVIRDAQVGTNQTADLSRYSLRKQDAIEVELTGIPGVQEPPTHQEISENGTITMKYIQDPIKAAGLTCQELAQVIKSNYEPRIYTHVNVTVTPVQLYFYVGGEINQTGPGRVPYNGFITVIRAIYAAGGFNEFGNRHKVRLTRVDGTIYIIDCVKALEHPELDLEVRPGDKINVPRRTLQDILQGQ